MNWTEKELNLLDSEEDTDTDKTILAMLWVIHDKRDAMLDELSKFFGKYATDGKITLSEAKKWVGEGDRRQRITILNQFIDELFDSTHEELSNYFLVMLSDIVARENEFFGTEAPLEPVIDNRWGDDEQNWRDRLERDVELWKAKTKKEVKHAFVVGLTLNELLKVIRKQWKSIDNVTSGLAMTEASHAVTSVKKAIFLLLGFEGFKYFAQMDERTCEICGGMHGIVFPMSQWEVGVTAPPMHPRCRCRARPIFRLKEDD